MNDARDFIPVLEKAVANGLKLALHLGEVSLMLTVVNRLTGSRSVDISEQCYNMCL